MTKNEFHFLQTLGDGKVHSFQEIEYLNRSRLKIDSESYILMIRKLLEYNWVKRKDTRINLERDQLKLTRKGDHALRDESIAHGRDATWFKTFRKDEVK